MKRPASIYLFAALTLFSLAWPLAFILAAPFYTGTVVIGAAILGMALATLSVAHHEESLGILVVWAWFLMTFPMGVIQFVLIVLAGAVSVPGHALFLFAWLVVEGLAILALKSRSSIAWAWGSQGDESEDPEEEPEPI